MGPNPLGSFRDNRAEWYKDRLLLLNIRLEKQVLILGPSSATKLWRCSPFNHWAVLVRLLSYSYLQHALHTLLYMHQNHWLFALFSQVISLHQKCIQYYDSPSISIQQNCHLSSFILYVHAETKMTALYTALQIVPRSSTEIKQQKACSGSSAVFVCVHA